MQRSVFRPASWPTGGLVFGGGGSFMPTRKYSPVEEGIFAELKAAITNFLRGNGSHPA